MDCFQDYRWVISLFVIFLGGGGESGAVVANKTKRGKTPAKKNVCSKKKRGTSCIRGPTKRTLRGMIERSNFTGIHSRPRRLDGDPIGREAHSFFRTCRTISFLSLFLFLFLHPVRFANRSAVVSPKTVALSTESIKENKRTPDSKREKKQPQKTEIVFSDLAILDYSMKGIAAWN